jgi:hypothetical protein
MGDVVTTRRTIFMNPRSVIVEPTKSSWLIAVRIPRVICMRATQKIFDSQMVLALSAMFSTIYKGVLWYIKVMVVIYKGL